MQKLFISLTLLIVLIISSIYIILFTKYGNSLISSYIESKVNNEEKNIKLKVNNFKLTLKTLDFSAVINDDSSININGDLSLFKKSVDLKYDIKINDISKLKNLINQELEGAFYTNGIFKGDKQDAIIQGFSNLANSQTKYYINLSKFEISNVQLDIKDAKIEDVLKFINKPQYIKGELNLNANIRNIDINNLDGLLTATISKALVNNDVVNKEFNQTISSNINFQSDIHASLINNKMEIKSELLSSVADLFINKTLVDLNNKLILSDYKIDVKNLNKLEGLIGKKLNGEFTTTGNLKFQDNIYFINGESNIFESSTIYKFELNDLVAQNIYLKIEKAKLEKLFHMLNEPIYAIGDLQVDAKIKNSSFEKMDGFIITKIGDAKIINEVVNTVFKQELSENIFFNTQIDTTLIPNQAISKIDIISDIGKIRSLKTIYDFKQKSFSSDYLLNIPSLEKIKGLTKIELRGVADVQGNIEKKETTFSLNGNSNIIGGVFDFNIKNDVLNATLQNINIKEFLYMIKKPQIFDSKGNVKFNYEMLSKKGNLEMELLNGYFLDNNFSFLINQLLKFDLTKELYEKVSIFSDINEKIYTTNLNMKSSNTQINMKDGIFDFGQNSIDAKLNTQIKDNDLIIKLKGDISKPNISLDTKELLKNEIDKKIEEKSDEVLDEKIKDEKTKELIKSLKFIF